MEKFQTNGSETKAVEAACLSYGYHRQNVLNDVSFSVSKKQFFIIIGPNGSGKTTLMKVLAGIEKPDEGSLNICGKPIENYSRRSLARTVAIAPQMTAMDFPFKVGEVVLMGRSPHKGLLGFDSKADLQIARRAMAFTGVEHLEDRKLDQISGG